METGDMNPNQSVAPLLCRANCGFYGSSAYDNYCSKCFKDVIRRQQDTSQPPLAARQPASTSQDAMKETSATQTPPPSAETSAQNSICEPTAKTSIELEDKRVEESESAKLDETQSESAQPDDAPSVSAPAIDESKAPAPPKKNRCFTCKKKIGLTGFDCRCGGKYCAEHRYSDAHSCTFDYKALGQQEVRKNNPVVVSEKINKL